MQRTTRQFTISLPPDLAEQVAATAKAESRTISELFRETYREYRARHTQSANKLSSNQFQSMLSALAEGSEGLPAVPSEAFTRESFYEDRT